MSASSMQWQAIILQANLFEFFGRSELSLTLMEKQEEYPSLA